MKNLFIFLMLITYRQVGAQNPLLIPPLVSGNNIGLTIQSGSQNFYGTPTPTYGINGNWMAPTILVNKDDSVSLQVTNTLPVSTTIHWHGLHVSPENDGGPHMEIMPNTNWNPAFKIRNQAGTFWYHPHGAGKTELHVAKGIAGFFLVKDSLENTMPLPRTYGVDDIPIVVQNRAFDALYQIAIASSLDTSIFVNGTLNPIASLPGQVVRFRLLNGSSLRSYQFGFSNNQMFYQIATDGGLVDTPVALTRILISPGERAEILVNFSGMVNQTVYLKNFGSEMPNGIYGAASVGSADDTITGYTQNPLNGADFNLMRIDLVSPTSNPITQIPLNLIPYQPCSAASATNFRTLVLDTFRMLPIDVPNRAAGPFGINNRTFNMDSINEVVHLNTTEIWTIYNRTLIAHPIHIHDIQFNILEKSGLPPAPSEKGWKDVVLVLPQDSASVITRFETFADPNIPYMYHCHLLHHEDDGMMGSFLVIDTTITGIDPAGQDAMWQLFPNPAVNELHIRFEQNTAFGVLLINPLGMPVYEANGSREMLIPTQDLFPGIYTLMISTQTHRKFHKVIKL